MITTLSLPRRAAVAAGALLAGVALALTASSLPGADAHLGKKAQPPVVVVDPSLNGASLNGASLNGASLNGASLNGASLNGASLNGASLNGASLNGASLNGASLN